MPVCGVLYLIEKQIILLILVYGIVVIAHKNPKRWPAFSFSKQQEKLKHFILEFWSNSSLSFNLPDDKQKLKSC